MPNEGMLEPGKFYADYPLWTVYSEDLNKKFGMPGGVPQLNAPVDGGPFLVIFTDVDLAVRFVSDLGQPNLEPVALTEPEGVLIVAEHFRKGGVKNVAIDFSFKPRPSAMVVPIKEFIEDVRRGDPRNQPSQDPPLPP